MPGVNVEGMEGEEWRIRCIKKEAQRIVETVGNRSRGRQKSHKMKPRPPNKGPNYIKSSRRQSVGGEWLLQMVVAAGMAGDSTCGARRPSRLPHCTARRLWAAHGLTWLVGKCTRTVWREMHPGRCAVFSRNIQTLNEVKPNQQTR